MKPYISFLIPTRKRVNCLNLSLESLQRTCTDIDSFEVIIITDNDDVETNEFLKSKIHNFTFKTKVRSLDRLGYNYLNEYYNLAAEISEGEWIWVWNDDTKMISEGWDTIIKKYDNEFLILNPFNTRKVDEEYIKTHTLFPIISKKFYQIFSRISPWNHIDTYIERVADGFDLIKNEFNIIHTHDKENDEVTSEIHYHVIPFPNGELEQDREKLLKYLKNVH